MTGRAVKAGAASRGAAAEWIRALATVTLDARALDELGPQTIDRLADLVAARLAERRAAGEERLLSVREAAEVAGAHPATVRKADPPWRSAGRRVSREASAAAAQRSR